MSNNTTPFKSMLSHFYEWEQQQPLRVFMRQPRGRQWQDISWAEAGD